MSRIAEGRGSAQTPSGGLDVELHFGMPSVPIAHNFDQNVDLAVFAGLILMVAVTNFAGPIPVENVAVAEVDEGNENDLAIVVNEGPMGGYDAVPGVGELGIFASAARTEV